MRQQYHFFLNAFHDPFFSRPNHFLGYKSAELPKNDVILWHFCLLTKHIFYQNKVIETDILDSHQIGIILPEQTLTRYVFDKIQYKKKRLSIYILTSCASLSLMT